MSPGDLWRSMVDSRPKQVAAGLVVAVLAISGLSWTRALWLRRALIAPEPTSILDDEWVPDLPTSVLNVPITYELDPVIAELEQSVDRVFGSIDERHELETNDRVSVAFEARRSPFRARLDGDVARVSTTLTYQGQGWYDAPLLPEVGASCGMEDDNGPPPRVVVELSARLALDPEWTLLADARVNRIAPASDEDRDKCRVTPFNIDMTGRVISAANDLLVGHLPGLEAAIASIDLRSKFQNWWAILHEPIELTDDVWLIIDPVSVHRGATRGSGTTLVTSVGLTARPRVVLGNRPEITVPELPPLDSAAVEDGLRIHAVGRGEYRKISEQLNEVLRGHELEQDGRTLVVEQLRARGIGGGRVALEVSFSGTARGRVYLVGTPQFDPVSGRVHVPDLQFDIASSNLLVNSYGWLRDQGITGLLRERARWPIEDLSALAAGQLDRGLNRFLTDGVELRGQVNSVDILGVYARVSGFVVHAQANAQAELIISDSSSAQGSVSQ